MKKTVLILSNVTTGLANFREELITELSKKYRVVVYAANTGLAERIVNAGSELIEADFDRHGKNPLSDLILLLKYIKIIKKYKPFIVLTYTIKPNVYGGLACSVLQVPYVSNITGLGDAIESNGLVSFISKNLYRLGLRKAYKVFFQNNSNQSFFLNNRLYCGDSEVLPGSGVNLEKYKYEKYPELNDDNTLTISVIGRVTKDKGADEVIEAARILPKDKIKIQIIGNCEGDYEELLTQAEKEGNLKYLGRKDNIYDYYAKCHAVLNASYHEGMSNVILEAAACGRPVLATDIPGCREAFEDGVTGISFKPKDVESLMEAVQKFYNLSYKEKIEMGIAGRHKVEKQFDRKIVVKKYLDEIKNLEKKSR